MSAARLDRRALMVKDLAMTQVVSIDGYRRAAPHGAANRAGALNRPDVKDVFFDPGELRLVLDLYAAMVAAGKWRDYAIAHDGESCSFSVYRRASDQALYRIVKTPKRARGSNQPSSGAYSVQCAGGRILRRGRTLAGALAVFTADRLALV
jgi:hypothetical protein